MTTKMVTTMWTAKVDMGWVNPWVGSTHGLAQPMGWVEPMGWVNPWVRLGCFGLDWVGSDCFHFLVGWVGSDCWVEN